MPPSDRRLHITWVQITPSGPLAAARNARGAAPILMIPGFDTTNLIATGHAIPHPDADAAPCPNPRRHDEHPWVLFDDVAADHTTAAHRRLITCQGQP